MHMVERSYHMQPSKSGAGEYYSVKHFPGQIAEKRSCGNCC